MKAKSIFWRILISFAAVVLLLVVGLGSYFLVTLRDQYEEMARAQLTVQAQVIGAQVEPLLRESDEAGINALCRRLHGMGVARVTVILRDGRVVGDSAEDYRLMDNHRNRPEIRHALQTGKTGSSFRHSATIGKSMIYLAMPLRLDGSVEAIVRTAMPLAGWQQGYRALRARLMLALLVTLLVAALLTFALSRSVWTPLHVMKETARHFANGDFTWRLPLDSPAEISSLAHSMNVMAAQLDEKMGTIQQQQHEQRAIIASMREGIVALNQRNHVILINKSAAEILGVELETAHGRSLDELTRHQALFDVMEQIRQDGAFAEADITLPPHEAPRYLQIRATRLRTSGERNIGILIVMNDVTRLRRLENIRRDFVANVSHELKTPITTIKGFVETLQENHLDEVNVRRYLGIIATHTDRLIAIIEDLLCLSRAETEQEHGTIVTGKASACDIVEAALSSCRREAQQKQITLEVDCAENLEVSANSDLLEQALLNLVGNAIKYSGEQTSVRIRVYADGEFVCFEITDQGPGIAEEHLPRVFERFYRVDKDRSRKLGGTGLGLAIVRHIALAHRGQVKARSTPGQGSTFSLRIPQTLAVSSST